MPKDNIFEDIENASCAIKAKYKNSPGMPFQNLSDALVLLFEVKNKFEAAGPAAYRFGTSPSDFLDTDKTLSMAKHFNQCVKSIIENEDHNSSLMETQRFVDVVQDFIATADTHSALRPLSSPLVLHILNAAVDCFRHNQIAEKSEYFKARYPQVSASQFGL